MLAFNEGFVINPDVYWRPSYRISPFTTSHVGKNRMIVKEGKTDQQLLEQYFGKDYLPCQNGREAIRIALKQYNLKPDDEVWIITTSGNKYISSCVTNEIKQICNWAMTKSEKTKLIFVNHEFGFCHPDLERLKKEGLPIIEDMALSFFSSGSAQDAGSVGDFVIYSLPKYFPVSFGGVLKFNGSTKLTKPSPVSSDLQHYFEVLLSHYLLQADEIKATRTSNYAYLAERFSHLGFRPFFQASPYEVPGVFMFRTSETDLNGLKSFMQENGVESSVFYGEEAFYIPVHHGLTKDDLDFFFSLVSYYTTHGNQ